MIFDLDGTLADTLPVCIAAFQDVFAAFAGRHYTDEEIVALFGVTEEGIIRRLVPDRWQAGLQAYQAAYERRHDRCVEPFAGIMTALDLLAERGVARAVVTGKGPASAEYSLRRLGLESAFSLVEAGSPDGPVKPEGLRRIVERWGIAPREAAYVGDADSDVIAALEVGLVPLKAAWASSAALTGEGTAPAAATFDTVDDFVAWIAQNVEPALEPAPSDSSSAPSTD